VRPFGHRFGGLSCSKSPPPSQFKRLWVFLGRVPFPPVQCGGEWRLSCAFLSRNASLVFSIFLLFIPILPFEQNDPPLCCVRRDVVLSFSGWTQPNSEAGNHNRTPPNLPLPRPLFLINTRSLFSTPHANDGAVFF